MMMKMYVDDDAKRSDEQKSRSGYRRHHRHMMNAWDENQCSAPLIVCHEPFQCVAALPAPNQRAPRW